MKQTLKHTSERGAVSIFIVLFTALLVTIVTTSFVQVMVRNQQQATNNDLSQSAYDSALAGVEDAKRALVALKSCELDPTPPASCGSLRTALADTNQKCTVLGDSRVNVATFNNDAEVPVGDASLNQAYTCVKVQVDTKSYVGTLDVKANQTVVIPLKSVGSPNLINGIRVSWYNAQDSQNNTPPKYEQIDGKLPANDKWPKDQPPVIRTQLVQFISGKLKLGDFDTASPATARTLFLYPTSGPTTSLSYDSDGRLTNGATNSPAVVGCGTDFNRNIGFACSTDITLPNLNPGAGETRQAYLVLSGLYKDTHYAIELLGASNQVINFNNVQPIVDSTGRASDLFRRVRANVSMSESGTPEPQPDGELSLGKNLCKDFFVTDTMYLPNATDSTVCEPSASN